ncbi:hypothetical protein VTL71DRAFT_13170 [Oculimacula yallundae]|uniref:Uncharacterized protein n=1 Tax=Oculimacula yallundae TaxID=86028 RepID=A0ABR4CQ25_9HELO
MHATSPRLHSALTQFGFLPLRLHTCVWFHLLDLSFTHVRDTWREDLSLFISEYKVFQPTSEEFIPVQPLRLLSSVWIRISTSAPLLVVSLNIDTIDWEQSFATAHLPLNRPEAPINKNDAELLHLPGLMGRAVKDRERQNWLIKNFMKLGGCVIIATQASFLVSSRSAWKEGDCKLNIHGKYRPKFLVLKGDQLFADPGHICQRALVPINDNSMDETGSSPMIFINFYENGSGNCAFAAFGQLRLHGLWLNNDHGDYLGREWFAAGRVTPKSELETIFVD